MCDLGFGQVSAFFKGLVSHCLAATKIQAQEMKMWGFEPSRACVPLSGGNGPPKSPATGNENLGLEFAKLF